MVCMVDFHYQGSIPASKSLFNRALIVQSYFPALTLHGESTCEDVVHMQRALAKISDRSHLDCGDGGTTFRFLVLRASRQRGVHSLVGSERLMQRPQKELLDILRQFGVQAQIKKNGLYMISEGWKKPRGVVKVDSSTSSQFASSLALNAWRLDFDLEFELTGQKVSESYFEMTLDLLKKLGMRISKTERGYLIPSQQRLSLLDWNVEPDISSTFSIAVIAALCGEAIIENFPVQSLQPDHVFLEIFRKMNVDFQLEESRLHVKRSPFLKSCEWNLGMSPDLFPVLAVLASQAHGVTKLFGAPHLAAKESDRIQKVADLFDLIGVTYEKQSDGMIIHGVGSNKRPLIASGNFDPDQDHRMVMAAMAYRMLGHQFKIEEPQAINKSFPEFWSIIGVHP